MGRGGGGPGDRGGMAGGPGRAGGAGDVEGPESEVRPSLPPPLLPLLSRPPPSTAPALGLGWEGERTGLTRGGWARVQVDAAKSRFALDVKEGRGGLLARYARASVSAPRKFLGLSLGVCVLLSAIAVSLKAFNLAEESNYDWIVKSDYAVRNAPLPTPLVPPPGPHRASPLDVKEGRGGLLACYARASVSAPRKFLGLSLRVRGDGRALTLEGVPPSALRLAGAEEFHGHSRLG